MIKHYFKTVFMHNRLNETFRDYKGVILVTTLHLILNLSTISVHGILIVLSEYESLNGSTSCIK